MQCPACHADIAASVRVCDFCTARIALDGQGQPQIVFPQARPGEIIFSLDFRSVPLPGQTQRDRKYDDGDVLRGTQHGVMVDAVNNVVWPFPQPYLRIRDVCVAASCVTYGKGLRPRVYLRSTVTDGTKVRYELVVSPEDQTFCIQRYCGSKNEIGSAALQPDTKNPVVAPIGSRNVLELRALGATLQAWINGTYVAAVHDAVLGIGGVGLANDRSVDSKKPHSTLWEWMQARTVVR